MNYVEQWNRNRVDWLYRLAREPALSAYAVRLGLLFATFLQPEEREEVRPSYDWLMANGQMSRATLSKAIGELEANGYILVERIHRYRNTYTMAFNGDGPWQPLSSKSER